ncbi:MAG: FkbM family methyltransferase [Myxococcota bacterium]
MGVLDTLRFIVRHPLAGKHPVRSVLDWARWQVGSRLVPGPVVVPFVGQTRLVVTRGMTGATGNIYCGLHELEDMAFALHYLRPDEVFADVGANVGSYTILAAGAAHALVHAFEPVPITFAALETNVRVNGLGARTVLQRFGVGDAPGELVMTSEGDTVNHILRPGESAPNTVRVLVRRLDDLLAGVVPALVKVDVEGYEYQVLVGGESTFAQCGAAIIEVSQHHDEVLGLIRQAGLEPVDYDPFTRTLIPLPGLNSARGNTIVVRDREAAQARVRAAQRFAVKRELV